MSKFHEDLAKLLTEVAPEVRSRLGFLSKIPNEILKSHIPDYDENQQSSSSTSTQPKRCRGSGNMLLFERIMDVQRALKTDCPEMELGKSRLLDKGRRAKILNVVASVKLAPELDLDQIAERSWNVEYNKKFFSGLIIQVSDPKATGLVYSTGMMIITGAQSELETKEAGDKCIEVVRKAGCKINPGDSYSIQNICATVQLGFKVRINEMGSYRGIDGWNKIINYNPEIFTGLVCNFENPKVTVVCFATGSLLFSGAQYEEDIQIAADRFRVLSYPFRH